MNNQRVSIITPVKNGAQFLVECLDSIVNQTHQNWELLIVNDSSTDETQSILEEYAQQDNRIVVSQNKGKGIIDALITGYEKSAGEFITRMDADDIMTPNKLELLTKKLIEKGKGYLATGFVNYFSETELGQGYFNYQEWLNGLSQTESNFDDIYKECVIPSPCWMVFREDFEASGGFNFNLYPEDYELTFRFYKQELKVVAVKEVIHHWRDYATRTSRTDSNYADNYFIQLKLNYFLELDYDNSRELELWGAGKKGKEVARFLIEKQIKFDWLSNNDKKIGKEVYGVILKDSKSVLEKGTPQILIAVGSLEYNMQIKKALNSKNLKPNIDYFFL
ncbi:MAG: glycosyltransferase involved in cell wall biosynthesis [Flavobacteriales bacterium]|jgi:glycosyltransferase involved in cell wall biosynthesis|tara:strand:+ start:676 stop:1680 length:1005 start_codon:yes stop_codon:yes gene_type:complete